MPIPHNDEGADPAAVAGLRANPVAGRGRHRLREPGGDAPRHPAADEDDDAYTGEDREEEIEQTLLEQLGGISGLIYSTLPVVVFVPANTLWGLTAAIWAALATAAGVLIWRLIRRSPIQPAISGFIGVAVCAFIAHRTGAAKGYFLFGIWASLVYAGVFLVSLLVRWPLAGVIWGVLNGHGHSWRSDRRAMRLYDLATVVWVIVFGARYLVQNHFYDTDSTGWLAAARIAMGWPLTAVALLVTVWAVRRAGHMPVSSATE
ncbi:DUF3159 domain-containing protein [Nocardia elegans]|uniref:DUF3159 domain-containing protein n=1 Tax=Nocardia nova TaxID=37330 RepID=A0A2T2YUR4_9NOCA|nr:DUF3159 domain-containing protein [Nocardia elegans]PSR59265.1 DUF3159 domain-containing protein [Nocardia nova]